MRLIRSVGQVLPSLKDFYTDKEKTGVIYLFPCSNCKYVYSVRTKRDLKSRLTEHKRTIRYQTPEQSNR